MKINITIAAIMVGATLLSKIVSADEQTDDFFRSLPDYEEFACSVEVVQYSDFDTTENDGFIAWSGERFFARFGDDFFLRDSTGEFLVWSEGSDAMPTEEPFLFGNFRHLKSVLEEKYRLKAKKSDGGQILMAMAKSEENPIVKISLEIDRKGNLKKLILKDSVDIETVVIFTRQLKEIPDKSIFSLPTGVDVVR